MTSRILAVALSSLLILTTSVAANSASRPNILFIMSDDHAAHAVGTYGGRLAVLNPTPTLDQFAAEGICFENCLVVNSICTPSRASILTGQYSQTNGVLDLDGRLPRSRHYLPQTLRSLGYQTAVIGKWHQYAEPDFDYYKIMVAAAEQGTYFDPEFIESGMQYGRHKAPGIKTVQHEGHSSDVITDLSIHWLKSARNRDQPFFLMHHFKAPHDDFEYAPRYETYLEDRDIPEPVSLYAHPYWGSAGSRGFNGGLERIIGSSVSRRHNTRNYVNQYKISGDRNDQQAAHEAYQIYLKKYLRCVKGVDDNLARLFAALKAEGLWDNTVIVYTSDQGMMLGEHDFMDKRWMYEPSIRMPFLVRMPGGSLGGRRFEQVINNVDFAPTLIELAGGEVPAEMQGRSFARLLRGEDLPDWDNATYYRYWMHMIHHDIPAHFGLRTERYKLILFYGYHYDASRMGEKSFPWSVHSNFIIQTPAAWEFYDLQRDPDEMINRYDDPAYQTVIADLKKQLTKRRRELKETDDAYPHLQSIIERAWD